MNTTAQVKFSFDRKGDNYLGQAEVPTRSGKLQFQVMVPIADIRQEVKTFLAKQPAEIAGDPHIVGDLDRVYDNVGYLRAKRRLGTAIKVRLGGKVRPFEVAGSLGFAHRMAQTAANRRGNFSPMRRLGPMQYRVAGDDEDDVSGNPFKAIGKGIVKGAKAVGKGTVKVAKVVGKGTVKGAKAVGKGTVKTAKFVGKGVTKTVDNPITAALLTTVPGGTAAMAIVHAARAGGSGAKGAIKDIKTLAEQGDPQAIASADVLEAAARGQTSSGAGIAIMAGLGLGALLLLKKR